MSALTDRLLAAMNAHDLDGAASLFHPDYRSEQPAHPARAFVGRAQMRANWAAMFTGIPDFQAEICRSVDDGDCTASIMVAKPLEHVHRVASSPKESRAAWLREVTSAATLSTRPMLWGGTACVIACTMVLKRLGIVR